MRWTSSTTAAARRAVAVLILLSAGCGGAQTPAPEPVAEPAPATAPGESAEVASDAPEPEPETEPDFAVLPLPSSDNIVPALKHGAESSGCGLTSVEGQRIAVTCEQDTLFLEQVGSELRYACQALADEDCKKLLGAIVSAAGRT